MAENYYLAIDIGASSGRHILGWMEDGEMKTMEVHRFRNQLIRENERLCWDVDGLFEEIKKGMKKCAQLGKIPVSMGIDTWGVDFVFVDKNGLRIGQSVGYRDDRTKGMDLEVNRYMAPTELYRRTGIQKQTFNTIYQLMWVKKNKPEWMQKADVMLMIPDYFHYLLTGIPSQEYTNATTTQLVNAQTKEWDRELIRLLGYKESLFLPLQKPGTCIGTLRQEVAEEVGFTCEVVLPPTHDTASAVLAVPSQHNNTLYISSGTWSLMGTELLEPNCSAKSMEANFTNEGGYEYRYRYLKNIMGLWMIQSVKKEWEQKGKELSFDEICRNASQESISSIVDCNDDRFLAPKSMMYEVQYYCKETKQQIPVTKWEVAAVIYNSLAQCYAKSAEKIERITGQTYDAIHIVGGGANAAFLNELTAKKTGKTVYAGPTEATAIGNLMAQMLAKQELNGIWEARECIFDSFEINTWKG